MGSPCCSRPCNTLGISPMSSAMCPSSSGPSSLTSSSCCRDHAEAYPRHPSTRDVHLALIRQHTGFRFSTLQDKHALETWLRTEGAPGAPTEEDCVNVPMAVCGRWVLNSQRKPNPPRGPHGLTGLFS